MPKKNLTIIQAILLSTLSAGLTLPRLKNGWSMLDDGFYAFVADRILKGEIIHKDFFSQYLGYQHVIHAILFKIFGEDYLSLRIELPLLTFLSALASISIFKNKGRGFQIAAVATVTGFSYLLFDNPSSSWTCEALALILAAGLTPLIQPSEKQTKSLKRLFFIGILLGIAIGVRHPTGVFLGIATAFALSLNQKDGSGNRLELHNPYLYLSFLAFVGLVVYLLASGSMADTALWGAAPLSYALWAIYRNSGLYRSWLQIDLLAIACGTIIALLPIIIYTTATESWRQMLSDLTTFSANYSSEIGIHNWYMPLRIIQAIAYSPKPAVIAASTVCLASMTFPLFILFLVSRRVAHRTTLLNDSVTEWLKSPLTIIATLHSLVVLGLLRDMYFSYIMAPQALATLALASSLKNSIHRSILTTAVIAAALTSFVFMSSKITGSYKIGYLGGEEAHWEDCELPRCNVERFKGYAAIEKPFLDHLNHLITKDSTVTIIPWSYDYDFTHNPINITNTPDTRLPMYQHIDPHITIKKLLLQPDPYFIVMKTFATPATISPQLALAIMQNAQKVYEDKEYIIFKAVKKN